MAKTYSRFLEGTSLQSSSPGFERWPPGRATFFISVASLGAWVILADITYILTAL